MSNDIHRPEYLDTVKAIAEEIGEAVRSGEIDEDEASDRVWEEVDGSQWIIYTHRATLVCQWSDNDSAYFDEYGALTADSWSDVVTKIAFAAMVADVSERLYDWLDDHPEIGEDEIRELLDEAGAHGDLAMVALCKCALDGDTRATLECARAIWSADA